MLMLLLWMVDERIGIGGVGWVYGYGIYAIEAQVPNLPFYGL